MDQDLIIGTHSIIEALKNPKRHSATLYGTKDGLKNIGRTPQGIKVVTLGTHEVQERAKEFCRTFDFKYQRIPSNVFLITSKLEELGVAFLYNEIETKKNRKILCLDQVTDTQNAAAILRTAAFFGIDYLLVSFKGSFGVGPSFSRNASGALEYIPIIRCAALPRTLNKLKELGVTCVGFSEHASGELEIAEGHTCLVLGSEDKGLSSAVMRILDKTVALKSQGPIKSLNVSVAAALAMDKFFGLR
ncbi:MAG: hypothetical protein DRQ88_06385 [Epsilonproteobacteria bacterium]|nr:MAG: hypothetical protein DRQ88_06385 [Campylobacterota bacterium]